MTNKFRIPKVITLHEEFPVVVGDSFSFDAYLYSDPQLERPMALGLGTVSVEATDDKANPTVSIVKTDGDGIGVVDAQTGHIRVFFSPTDTASLGQYGGRLYFDVRYEDEDGNVFTVAKGTLKLQPDTA